MVTETHWYGWYGWNNMTPFYHRTEKLYGDAMCGSKGSLGKGSGALSQVPKRLTPCPKCFPSQKPQQEKD